MGELLMIFGAGMIFTCVCQGIDHFSRVIEEDRIRRHFNQILNGSDKLK